MHVMMLIVQNVIRVIVMFGESKKGTFVKLPRTGWIHECFFRPLAR